MLSGRHVVRVLAGTCALLMSVAFGGECVESAYPPGTQVYAEPLPDPLEGFNRGVHVFNKVLYQHLAYPIGASVDFLVPDPLQRGLRNAGHNMLYPMRLVNTCLQGKWSQAWDETKRFGVNSTVGVLGFRDQATLWDIPSHNEDFGQTFGYYGIGPGFFLNLPLLGPSTGRDAIGLVLDYPFDLVRWIFPSGTATAINSARMVNVYSMHAATLRLFFDVQEDSYAVTRAGYTLRRETLIADYQPPADFVGNNPDQTMGYVMLQPKRKDYALQGCTRRLRLAGAVEKLPYTSWHCPHDRGVLVILPGIGGHRLSAGVAALAELFVGDGWSVIALSSSFTPDFFLGAAPAGYLPGNFRADAALISAALRMVLADYRRHYPDSSSTQALMGISLGALNTLYLAEREARGEAGELSFAQYLAINPPVDPLYALRRIDEFFAIPASWPEAEREACSRELLHRLASLLTLDEQQEGQGFKMPPMTLAESRFLIGLNMRLELVETLIASQRVANMGVLRNDPNKRNSALEVEALGTGYEDYARFYMLPYLLRQNPSAEPSQSLEKMASGLSLRSLDSRMRDFAKVTIFMNRNDFLLRDDDAAWCGEFFGERAVFYPVGGHLGNMAQPDYQAAMRKVLDRARH
jgi:phospholipid-binding lipoprotein MlaA